MSIRIILQVWNEHSGFFTGIEKAVLIRLADFGSDSGNEIFPGMGRLAKDTGFHKTTIIKTIKSLQEKKILTKKIRNSKIQNITNLYSINVRLLSKLLEKKPNKVTKKHDKGGSSGERLGSSGERLGGSSGALPDPLFLYPLVNNNTEHSENNETKLTNIVNQPTANVVVGNGISDIQNKEIKVKELTDAGVFEKVAKRLAEKHKIERILEVIAASHDIEIAKKGGWIKQALDEGWDMSTKKIPAPNAGKVAEAETKARIAEIDAHHAKIAAKKASGHLEARNKAMSDILKAVKA